MKACQMNALMWHTLYDAFARFAAHAREIHFYDDAVDAMEKSIFEMSPYAKHKKEGTAK